MAKTCIKCGHTRRDSEPGPDYACPSCGIVYAKAEAAQARIEAIAAQARERATASQPAPLAAPAPAPAAPALDPMLQQMLLAQAGGAKRGASPYRGVALAALVAFALGFAAAAGMYSGLAKLNKPAAKADCRR